ncbi:MAG: polyprenyl synthetase family protein, partial [Planctomycetota bacterium]
MGELGKGLEEQLASGGKGLRPALCLWLAELLGCPLGDAMPFAVAVEMLHNAFLIHDDIEDGDEFRRDCPALWARFGIPIALNVADLLHAVSKQRGAQHGN